MARLSETIPTLAVRDLEKAVDFYEHKLGFVPRHREDGFAIVRRDGAELHLTRLNDESWTQRSNLHERPVVSGAESFLAGTGTCRIRVDGLAELFAEYEAHGALPPTGHIRDQWWGDRDFVVLDVDRNALTFFEPADPARPA